jgi:conjugative transfer region protein TrbK
MRRDVFLLVGAGLSAAALMALVVRAELHQKPSAPMPHLLGDDIVAEYPPVHRADTLADTLTRCSALGAAAETDADCHQAWAESRVRFLGEKTAQSDHSVAPNLGRPLDEARDPKMPDTSAPDLGTMQLLPLRPMALPVLPKNLSSSAQEH